MDRSSEGKGTEGRFSRQRGRLCNPYVVFSCWFMSLVTAAEHYTSTFRQGDEGNLMMIRNTQASCGSQTGPLPL